MELCVEKRSELVLGLLSSEIRLFRRESEFSYFRVFFFFGLFLLWLVEKQRRPRGRRSEGFRDCGIFARECFR